jgi:hypothetical protein
MRRLSFDIPMLMSLLTVLGMILATVGTWPLAEALGVLRCQRCGGSISSTSTS